MTNSWH